jgi:cyclophilin family peptidyl-prolyl cis-trans isomerase
VDVVDLVLLMIRPAPFGEVVSGMDILRKIAGEYKSGLFKTESYVAVVNCGTL